METLTIDKPREQIIFDFFKKIIADKDETIKTLQNMFKELAERSNKSTVAQN